MSRDMSVCESRPVVGNTLTGSPAFFTAETFSTREFAI